MQTFTHRDLARETGVSETTIKSYRRKFPEFISVASRGKPIRFNPQTLSVCLRIRDLFGRNFSVEEVRDVLNTEFQRQTTVDSLSKSADSTADEPALERVAQLLERSAGTAETALQLHEATAKRIGRLEAMVEDLYALQSRIQTLQAELLGKLDTMVDTPRRAAAAPQSESASRDIPPDAWRELPVVIRSEHGEFLGVTGKDRRPLTLREFETFLQERAPGAAEPDWRREGGGWVMTLTGDDMIQGQRHEHFFKRTTTPLGNHVVHFHRLRIDGEDVTDAFLQAFLRQIKDALSE
jgi:DNA-binding transcriptional MerR regulator